MTLLSQTMEQTMVRRASVAVGAGGLVLVLASSGLGRQSPPILPDQQLAPGDVLAVNKADICR